VYVSSSISFQYCTESLNRVRTGTLLVNGVLARNTSASGAAGIADCRDAIADIAV